jgi:hypothetical protein
LLKNDPQTYSLVLSGDQKCILNPRSFVRKAFSVRFVLVTYDRCSLASAFSTSPLGQSATWRDLEVHSQDIRNRHLQALFTADPNRGQRMMAERAGVYLDYSKNRTTGQTMERLLELAEGSGLHARIAMFRGEKINRTEDRAVLHVVLHLRRLRKVAVLEAQTVSP